MNPVEQTVERVRDFWDRKATTFDQGDSYVSRTDEVRRNWMEVFRSVLGPERRRLLDVGSGTGELACLFHDLGHDVQGVDIAPSMVAFAREKAEKRGLSIGFRQGDAHRLPFPDGSFDAVHARHLLWTLPDPRGALREWIRVLAPGGVVVVTEAKTDGGGPLEGAKRRVGRAVAFAVAAATGAPKPGPAYPPDYPGRDLLPFRNGLGMEGLAAFLRNSGLARVETADLLWLRRLQRSHIPWYRRLMSSHLHSYYAAWGVRP